MESIHCAGFGFHDCIITSGFRMMIKKYHRLFFTTQITLFIFPTTLLANTAYPGFTGLITTPDANILPDGDIAYQYNTYNGSNINYDETYNHLISIGTFPYIEITGRLTDYIPAGEKLNTNGTKKGQRDLSANIKIQLPKFSKNSPNIAIGANDVIGEATNFRSQYLVLSQQWNKGVYSLGYATGENEDFKGVFSGIHYEIFPRLNILAEYDTKQSRIGLNYNLKDQIGIPLVFQVSAPFKDKNDLSLALSYQVSLKNKSSYNKNKNKNKSVNQHSEQNETNFINTLREYQFENIRLGRGSNNEMILALDSRVYNQNPLDILGLAYGIAFELLPNEESLTILLNHNGIEKIATKVPLVIFGNYLSDASEKNLTALNRYWQAWYPNKAWINRIRWNFIDNKTARTRIDIKIQPDIRTAIGTEWGIADYSLAAKLDINLSLWKGANLLTSWDMPVNHTPLFDTGSVFASSQHQSGLQQAFIQQTLKPSASTVGLVSAGLMNIGQKDYYSAQLETAWHSQTGKHRIYAKSSKFYAKEKDFNNEKDSRNLAIASYRYQWPIYNLSTEVSYGQFFEQEKGLRIDMTRDFNRSQINGYVKYIDKQDIAAGLQLSVPLTPQKDFKYKGLVVRGNENWRYTQEDTVKDPVVVGSNRIRTNVLLDPSPRNTLKQQYSSSDRLTPNYFSTNLPLLREAFFDLKK